MISKKELICLITQSLFCAACPWASAEAVKSYGTPFAYQPPHAIPVPSDLIGYRLIVTVVLSNPIDSKNAKIGDAVQGRLKDAFVLGGRVYASKNARVNGHITACITPRTMSQALGSDRRFNSRAALLIQFDEIIDESGARIPVLGVLSPQTVSIPGKNAPAREVKVDAQGRIIKAEEVLSETQRNVYNTARAATVVPIPGSILLSMAGTPVVMGAAGAADPSFAYNKPIDADVSHRRVKGFIYAFLSNLPGAVFVQAIVEKGDEIRLKAGDELAVEMRLKENHQSVPGPYAVADVRGAVLTKSNSGAPLPGNGSSEEGEGLIAQSAKMDDTPIGPGLPVMDPTRLIRPSNGGQRLLPANDWAAAPNNWK